MSGRGYAQKVRHEFILKKNAVVEKMKMKKKCPI